LHKSGGQLSCGNIPIRGMLSKYNFRERTILPAKTPKAHSKHPDHSALVKKLNRVIGQVQGVQRMIEDNRYCPDILMQSRAAASALKAVELAILETHLRHCVKEAMSASNPSQADEKIRELLELFIKR
jgi:CsoR family transcriptional regulator, copper-sensing transcriptional repressor